MLEMPRDMSLEASDLNVSSFSRAFSSLYKTKQKVSGPKWFYCPPLLQYGKKLVLTYKTMESWIKYGTKVHRYRTKALFELISANLSKV
jgi:hypothetical protein